MEEQGTFLVLAAEERLPDLNRAAAIMAGFQGLSMPDAAKAARHSWGFLGRGLDEEKADGLLRTCEAHGVRALKLPSAGLPKLEEPLRLASLAPAVETLDYTGADGKGGKVLRTAIRVLSAAPLKTETSRTVTSKEGPSTQERAVRLGIMAVTGLPIGLGKSKEVKKEVKSSELSFYMDLVMEGGARLRFCSDDLDFSYLAAEKTYSSQVNFRLTALKLAAFLPKALKNTCLWAMLESRPLGALPYDSMEDFETESLRLLALSVAKG